jgi:p-hydroxybenzoate 3-monooxygenase
MQTARTQVGIVGAGPAGLLLGHLLHLSNIDSVILESRDRDHVIERVRAGVLEQGTVDLLHAIGVGDRLGREGLRHEGLFIAFSGRRHRINLSELTGGRAITIYGQNEVVKDLIGARLGTGRSLRFEVSGVSVTDIESTRPVIRYRHDGQDRQLSCDFVAGCDGSHGVCRGLIPPSVMRPYERVYPFSWLGILAEAAPSSPELVYSLHENGFALFSMRSPNLTRLYLQCSPEEKLAEWPDDRIWSELRTRLHTSDGWEPAEGRILQKGVTPMRSFVAEPMQHGRLFLAGDAAHVVPPTGAKGLNLAAADVWRLSAALGNFYQGGTEVTLQSYTERGLRRAWRAQRFSWWMTSMLHRSGSTSPFDHRRQLADLDYLVSSQAAMTSLAENYVGVPFS